MLKRSRLYRILKKRATALTSFYLLLVVTLSIAAVSLVQTSQSSITRYNHITENAIDISHILLDIRREAEAVQMATIRMIFNTKEEDVKGEKEFLVETHKIYRQNWENFGKWMVQSGKTALYDTLNYYRQQDRIVRQEMLNMSVKGARSNEKAVAFYYTTQHPTYWYYQESIEYISQQVKQGIDLDVNQANTATTEGAQKVNYLLLLVFIMMVTGGVLVSRNHYHLSKMQKMAEASSKAKSEFMSNMSHELRTPMNGIIGFTDLILTTELKPVQKEYLKNVNKSANNLLHIINDILDFSKMEAGKLLLDKTPFNFRELVEETVDLLSINAEEKKIEVICIIDPLLPLQFLGDASRTRQILVNLLGNAIKFTSSGEIAVEVRDIDTSGSIKKGLMNVALSVRDTGIGIPADKINEVFAHFSQVDSSTTRRYGGTGLGLTIARALAQLMSGTLTAQSELGKGSTFTLTIPLEVLDETPSVKIPVRPALRKVLVVDDNETNRSLMRDTLQYMKVPCHICCSGPEAIKLITAAVNKNEMYDLIITDHQMPEMDGITMVKNVKELLGSTPRPFILMLSSVDRTAYQRQALDSGIDKFLNKPVKLKEFCNILTAGFSKSTENAEPYSVQIKQHSPLISDIMVVENEPINMLLISEVLKSKGINVVEAFNGKEALDKLTFCQPAMIFMDINMPEMDGLEVTRIIRQSSPHISSIPIVALTADALHEDRQRCLAAGMNDYVSKPFRGEEIDVVLDEYYHKKK